MLAPISPPLVILYSLLLCLPLLSGCSEEPSAKEKAGSPVQLVQLNPKNQSEFVGLLVGDYLDRSENLIQHYLMSRNAGDVQGFVRYRNQSWTPEYMARKELYEQILHKNKAYIYRHQINDLFDCFMSLQRLSLHLKHSLQNSDPQLGEQVMGKLAADQETAISYLSDLMPVAK